MSTSLQQDQKNRIVLLLWSALFIKCFSLEYLVIRYTIPINSTIYVWCLSLMMAGIASVTYLRLKINKPVKMPHHLSLHQCIWALAAISIITISIIGHATNWLSDLGTLPLNAILIGLCYTLQGLLLKHLHYVISGFGWWIGAAALFRLSSPNDLLAFASYILLLSSLPMLVHYIHLRQRQCSILKT